MSEFTEGIFNAIKRLLKGSSVTLAIIYTLGFTSKFYLYGPVTSGKIIKTVQVDQYANLQDQAPKREQRYTVTPDPITADSDDDFGFSETVSFFQDAKDRDLSTGEDKTSTNN